MEPSENAGDKVTPTPSFFNGTTILALLIIVAQILISAGTYPFLPPMVPSHFDAAGNVNGYLPKLVNAILLPGISIFLFLVLRFVTTNRPEPGLPQPAPRQYAGGQSDYGGHSSLHAGDPVAHDGLWPGSARRHLAGRVPGGVGAVHVPGQLPGQTAAQLLGRYSHARGRSPATSSGRGRIAWAAGCSCWSALSA